MANYTVKELQNRVDKMVASADEIGLGFAEFWKGVVNSKQAFAKKIKSQKKGTYIQGSEYMMRVVEIQKDDLHILVKEERRRGRKARRVRGDDKEVDKTTALTTNVYHKLKELRSTLDDQHGSLVDNDNQKFKKLLAKEQTLYNQFLVVLKGFQRELDLLLKEKITAKNAKSIANGFANIALGTITAGIFSGCSTTGATGVTLYSSLASLETASHTILAGLALVPGGAATLVILLSGLLVVIVKIRRVKEKEKAKVAAARKAAAKESALHREDERKNHEELQAKNEKFRKVLQAGWSNLKGSLRKHFEKTTNIGWGNSRGHSEHKFDVYFREIYDTSRFEGHGYSHGHVGGYIQGFELEVVGEERKVTHRNVHTYTYDPTNRAGDYLGPVTHQRVTPYHKGKWSGGAKNKAFVIPLRREKDGVLVVRVFVGVDSYDCNSLYQIERKVKEINPYH
jgi:hypothetical protein